MEMKSLCESISRIAKDRFPVIVALSGGVDSSLVAYAAHTAVGNRAIAVTVHNELIGNRDFTRAVEIAEHIGMEHHPLLVRALEDKLVRRNNEDRCYHCKKNIFTIMKLEYGDDCLILDGSNADDDPNRPGLRAIAEYGVVSPLRTLGIGKDEIREMAKAAGLPSWNYASESCLATRIPVGIPLSVHALDKVQSMETFLHQLGVHTVRARHDNLVATVEHLPQYTELLYKNRDKFAALIEKIGLRSFKFKEWHQ